MPNNISSSVIVDADSHIMEPADLWEKYIDPQYRNNCIKIVRDETDGDKLIVNGITSKKIPRLGGMLPKTDEFISDWNSLHLSYYESYQDSCLQESYKPGKRIQWMDQQAITASILFPSLSLLWPIEFSLPNQYIHAHFQAYNRWIQDFASISVNRLIPVALTFIDNEDLAINELKNIAAQGFKAIMLPAIQGGKTPFAEQYSRFWATCEDLDLLVCLHKVAIPYQLKGISHPVGGIEGNGKLFQHVNEILSGQQCLLSIFDTLMPDRHPKLRYGFFECNAGWLPSWLDRMDESYEVLKTRNIALVKEKPSTYVNGSDKFYFTLGGQESPQRLYDFENQLMIASDFPHPGSSTNPVPEWQETLKYFSVEVQQAILGKNTLTMLGYK